MSATISNQTLTGVSVNALHLRDGNLTVEALEVSRREVKKSNAVPADLGNFHTVFDLKNTQGKTALVGTELVTDSVPSRSTTSVKLIFPADGSMTSGDAGINSLMDLSANLFVSGHVISDYAEPAQDQPAFNFSGSYSYTENGVEFNVTDVTMI